MHDIFCYRKIDEVNYLYKLNGVPDEGIYSRSRMAIVSRAAWVLSKA